RSPRPGRAGGTPCAPLVGWVKRSADPPANHEWETPGRPGRRDGAPSGLDPPYKSHYPRRRAVGVEAQVLDRLHHRGPVQLAALARSPSEHLVARHVVHRARHVIRLGRDLLRPQRLVEADAAVEDLQLLLRALVLNRLVRVAAAYDLLADLLAGHGRHLVVIVV